MSIFCHTTFRLSCRDFPVWPHVIDNPKLAYVLLDNVAINLSLGIEKEGGNMKGNKTANKREGQAKLMEPGIESDERVDRMGARKAEVMDQASDFIGLDIGTSRVVVAKKQKSHLHIDSQLNAFFTVHYSKFTEDILVQNDLDYYIEDSEIVVYGDGAEKFANMFNAETRRPMQHGTLNPKEEKAIRVIKAIINRLLGRSTRQGEIVYFSVPGTFDGRGSEIIHHEAIIKNHLESLGYDAKSINEGLAIVFSELEKDNFTGIGISCGGGTCNICLAFLSVPIFSYSISKAGDYIDTCVSSVTDQVNTWVRLTKEQKLDLTKKPSSHMENALHIYYDDVISSLVRSLRDALHKSSNMPNLNRPIPIVVGGGTAMPRGFQERFQKALLSQKFPIDISEVRLAFQPLDATAKGALIASMRER
jgi:hypothetical protein